MGGIWKTKYFLPLAGLDPDQSLAGKKLQARIREGDVDWSTGGAVAVLSTAELDGKGGADKISIDFWSMRPNGDQQTHRVIELTTRKAKIAGNADSESYIGLRDLWVMGRRIDLESMNDDRRIATVNRVMEAVRRINMHLRNGGSPKEFLKIMYDCHLDEVIGKHENLEKYMVGVRRDGSFSFKYSDLFNRAASGDSAPIPPLDKDIAVALMHGENTLDPHRTLRPGQHLTVGGDTESGVAYASEMQITNDTDSLHLSADIEPVAAPSHSQARGIEKLVDIFMRAADNDNGLALQSLRIVDEELTRADFLTRMRGLGVARRVLESFRDRRYPEMMKYLAEFDLLDSAYQLSPPSKDGRGLVISLFGNSTQELVDGFGAELGACKAVISERLDENGHLDRVAAIHDFGWALDKTGAVGRGAVPDVVGLLQSADHFFITHRHLDHCDAVVTYAQKGYLLDKMFHATPEVIRAMRHKLQQGSVKKHLWPRFQPLTEAGHYDIEKDGEVRIRVHYSPDGTPHSTRCTPMRYECFSGGQKLMSYLNPGDMRFDDTVWRDDEFFDKSGDTLVDIDITSIVKQGQSPTEKDVEENLALLAEWFSDKGILLPMISTNDNRFETLQRVASRTGRHTTEAGANVEETAKTANKFGVNRHFIEPEDRYNIQHYKDKFEDELVQGRLDTLNAQLEAATTKAARTAIEKDIAIESWIQTARAELKSMIYTPAQRYERQQQLESELHEQFGVKRSLGSIRVGRVSKTAKHIIAGDPGRRLVAITGTQGNQAEVDAFLSKLADGRSLADADPKTRHTAIPMNPRDNIIIISQSAIPGNEKRRQKLVERLVNNRNFTVIESIHGGLKIHNPKEKRSLLLNRLTKAGQSFYEEQDGSITVNAMPIHSSGHGFEGDVRAWMEKLKKAGARFVQPQHIADPEAIKRFYELADDVGISTLGRMVENFEALELKHGQTPEDASGTVIGRIPASLILVRIVRKLGQYYGGHIEAERTVVLDGQGGLRSGGLMAGQDKGDILRKRFGVIDEEAANRDKGRDEDDPNQTARRSLADVVTPEPERKYSGPRTPRRQKGPRFNLGNA